MSYLVDQLIEAAKAGDLAGVQDTIARGADARSNADALLRNASTFGHLHVVQYLLAAGADARAYGVWALLGAASNGHLAVVQVLCSAGADIHALDAIALRRAAAKSHLSVVGFLRTCGAPVETLLDDIQTFSTAVQVALLSFGDVNALSAPDLARQGFCPEALCVLLERQGQAGLAEIIKASQMFEPLDLAACAELLEDLLARTAQLESLHVGP